MFTLKMIQTTIRTLSSISLHHHQHVIYQIKKKLSSIYVRIQSKSKHLTTNLARKFETCDHITFSFRSSNKGPIEK